MSSIPSNLSLEKDKLKDTKEKPVKEMKDKSRDSGPSEGRMEATPVHYLPKKRRIQQKLDEEASTLPAVVVAKKSRIEEQFNIEITVRTSIKRLFNLVVDK